MSHHGAFSFSMKRPPLWGCNEKNDKVDFWPNSNYAPMKWR